MDLSHNQAFRILEGPDSGMYRVLLNEGRLGTVAVVRLDPPLNDPKKGGRRPLSNPKRPSTKPQPPMLGRVLWVDLDYLNSFRDGVEITRAEIEQKNYVLSQSDEGLFQLRKESMAPFLDYDHFREMLLAHKGINGLVKEVVAQGKSEYFVRKNFSLLCRYGFDEASLRPIRSLNCGAPGVPRPCDPGGRKKAGRKTNKQRISGTYGIVLNPDQPGMSSLWRSAIIAADKRIPSPKPPMPERVQRIISTAFVTRYQESDGRLISTFPALGEYPNSRQIRRVLEREISSLQRLLEKTTKGHFDRSMRGLTARSWQGVVGPGHTWAIDSTIADVYLRSSVNRAWIIGRPIVYVIVDVWSTAVVGFYVCLDGPSWAMAKVALFCSVADHQLLGNLCGHEFTQSLSPSPEMCASLLCDRGEYLSMAAKATGAKLILDLSYTPPYRPDLKGLVEVLHRIKKDRQYYFIPGAIDARRKELELRRFDPNDAVMTIHEYSAFLHEVFTNYNLTAPREDRLDVFMRAAGVFPSPAGLWRYGHEIGVGVRRHITQNKLITELLPSETATVTRRGVKFLGMEYSSPEIESRGWTANARNFHTRNIQAHYYPGSVSRIWTPDPDASGLLELQLSDQSVASPELSIQEFLDAFMAGKIGSQENQHIRMAIAFDQRKKMERLVQQATELTAEALSKASGKVPSLTEARAMEGAMFFEPNVTAESPKLEADPLQTAYMDMMASMFSAINT